MPTPAQYRESDADLIAASPHLDVEIRHAIQGGTIPMPFLVASLAAYLDNPSATFRPAVIDALNRHKDTYLTACTDHGCRSVMLARGLDFTSAQIFILRWFKSHEPIPPSTGAAALTLAPGALDTTPDEGAVAAETEEAYPTYDSGTTGETLEY